MSLCVSSARNRFTQLKLNRMCPQHPGKRPIMRKSLPEAFLNNSSAGTRIRAHRSATPVSTGPVNTVKAGHQRSTSSWWRSDGRGLALQGSAQHTVTNSWKHSELMMIRRVEMYLNHNFFFFLSGLTFVCYKTNILVCGNESVQCVIMEICVWEALTGFLFLMSGMWSSAELIIMSYVLVF